MNNIRYPNRITLENWVRQLKASPSFPFQYLPMIHQNWHDAILGIIELLQTGHYPNTLHEQAALLFYKVIKNHYFTDGNKRSAVLVLYLFYIVNDHVLLPVPKVMLRLARTTARTASNMSEQTIQTLVQKLENISKKL